MYTAHCVDFLTASWLLWWREYETSQGVSVSWKWKNFLTSSAHDDDVDDDVDDVVAVADDAVARPPLACFPRDELLAGDSPHFCIFGAENFEATLAGFSAD